MEYGALRYLTGNSAAEPGTDALDEDSTTTIEANNAKARHFVNTGEA